MRPVLLLLLLAGYARAQPPGQLIKKPIDRADSLPRTTRMPTARSNNSFYRLDTDPENVMRATLDNMPVKVPDSATAYTIQQSRPRPQPYYFLPQPPTRPKPPVPPLRRPRKD